MEDGWLSRVWGMLTTEFPRDMANIEVEWEVEGIISPEESVTKMLTVIEGKGKSDSGTFWCWDGRVCIRDTSPTYAFSSWVELTCCF